ncbi:348_t:CDS:2, partial [Funneliformis caledonium]
MNEEVLSKVRFSEYWKKPQTHWKLDTFSQFFHEKHPDASKQTISSKFVIELKILNENLKPKSKEGRKISAILKVSVFTRSQECENVNEHSEHSEHSECYALFSAVMGKSVPVTLVPCRASLWIRYGDSAETRKTCHLKGVFVKKQSPIDENILESFIRNLRQEPKNEWIVQNINVTEIFLKYQREVLKTLQSTGLTWDNT